jgi:hypothetical protein
MWDKNLIHKIQINFQEAGADAIGIHAFVKGHSCRYFEIPLHWADEPGFFSAVYERLKLVWKLPDELEANCPTCGHPLRLFERRYQGFRFCGYCGTYYTRRERDGGFNITVLALRRDFE